MFDSFSQVRKLLYNHKRRNMSKLPQSRSEVQIPDVLQFTVGGEVFLQANMGEHDKIIIFASRRHLQYLANSDIVMGDGTFYIAPTHFRQLYVLHGKVFNHFWPLLFGILPDKSEATYRRFFDKVKDLLQSANATIEWQTFLIDFELAAKNAILSSFNSVHIKGCAFHYSQCLWRKIQELGLSAVSVYC